MSLADPRRENGGSEAKREKRNLLSLRFPKSARLRRSAEFQKLKREGRSFHGKFMVLSVLQIASSEPPRIGIVTSRRVGGAVVRNRARRRLREIVRSDRARLASGRWLVIVLRQRAAAAAFAELQSDWRGLAEKAALFIPQA